MYFHNDLCDRVADLARKALTPTQVSDDPLINPDCAVQSGKDLQA